jgi:purine-binding chemotaxis protein CheW
LLSFIIFNVGSNRYAINIDNVQRIVHARDLTAIPKSNKFIDGMMSYEDDVIKVLNFRKLIGLEPHKEDSVKTDEYTQKFIIFEKDDSCFAIKVDSIEDIAHIEESKIMKRDEEGYSDEFLRLEGVLDLDGVLINVIKTVSLPN